MAAPKPKIVVGVSENGRIVVRGDTYEIKEILKKHGFMFNSLWKIWEKFYYHNEDLIKEALKLIEDLNGKAEIKLLVSKYYLYKKMLEE